ncbi:hypothetical protein [Candidatus Williamhamiltonella defendens]|uniref:hypothetical protein n=1 Tax=Candidatus Williamhamiltonella defendens TaxID=138072 RepID=UPI0016513383|nr:hypothetical protein [Candidatus Hamiltonella defensa]
MIVTVVAKKLRLEPIVIMDTAVKAGISDLVVDMISVYRFLSSNRSGLLFFDEKEFLCLIFLNLVNVLGLLFFFFVISDDSL